MIEAHILSGDMIGPGTTYSLIALPTMDEMLKALWDLYGDPNRHETRTLLEVKFTYVPEATNQKPLSIVQKHTH